MTRSPAERLLLELLRSPAGRTERIAAALDAKGIDWRLFRNPSVGWSLAPLLHHHLERSGLLARVPEDLAAEMAALRRHTALRNAVLRHALIRIADAFGAAAIPLVALKGADLMLTAYDAPEHRILRDLDLLVPRDRVDDAEATLRRLGFRPGVEMARDWFDANHHHGVEWHGPDGITHLELHWALARPIDPFHLDERELFAHARPLEVGGARLLGLAPDDNLEYLAVHAFRHLTASDWALHSVADIVRLLERRGAADVPAAALAEAARRHGTGLPLALAFDLLAPLWPDGALEPLCRETAATVDARLLGEARALIAITFRLSPQQSQPIVSGLMGLGQMPGFRARLDYLRRGLFPPARDLTRDLPRGAFRWPLPLRYLALVGRYTRELAQTGFNAGWAAYRLGRLRREMQKRLPGSRPPPRPGDA